jgi:hypothetical protein
MAVDESGERIERDVLEQREVERRPVAPSPQLVVREPEERAVRRVHGEADRAPRGTARDELAEHRDV